MSEKPKQKLGFSVARSLFLEFLHGKYCSLRWSILSHCKTLVSRGIKVFIWQWCEGIFGFCKTSGGSGRRKEGLETQKPSAWPSFPHTSHLIASIAFTCFFLKLLNNPILAVPLIWSFRTDLMETVISNIGLGTSHQFLLHYELIKWTDGSEFPDSELKSYRE